MVRIMILNKFARKNVTNYPPYISAKKVHVQRKINDR
jgi:hypothetical protein